MLKLQVLKNMTFVNDIFIGLAFSVIIVIFCDLSLPVGLDCAFNSEGARYLTI